MKRVLESTEVDTRENQWGFGRGRSCAYQIMLTRKLSGKLDELKNVFFSVSELEKANDRVNTVDREAFW